jgi:hypothetical protein
MNTRLSSRTDIRQHATDQQPRIRPSATATNAVSLLDREERSLLEHAAAAGGSYTISGLAGEDMVHAASVALMLQWRGLVRAKVRFTDGVPGQPALVTYELTDDGLGHLVSDVTAA